MTLQPAKVPLARVKRIMKEDPEVMAVSNAAVQHVAAASQLFIGHFAEQALMAARAEGRQRIGYRDFAQAADSNHELGFLGPLVPKTVPFGRVQEMRESAGLVDEKPRIPFPRREEQLEADEEDRSD